MIRENVGFEIIESVKTGVNEEVVIGYNRLNYMPYVTWICYNGNNYNHGHYFKSVIDAAKDFEARVNG